MWTDHLMDKILQVIWPCGYDQVPPRYVSPLMPPPPPPPPVTFVTSEEATTCKYENDNKHNLDSGCLIELNVIEVQGLARLKRRNDWSRRRISDEELRLAKTSNAEDGLLDLRESSFWEDEVKEHHLLHSQEWGKDASELSLLPRREKIISCIKVGGKTLPKNRKWSKAETSFFCL
ncbi:hypothetical protein HPP92_012438 [Vanilla planifolia]|uniref:Uncharacterized protein n=1 Tax=Vanilla planifolia TaxID=51239 RepID=A0A835QXI9_VANPL|nr:hypothetical protein HPP92_012438 [Vanilla planifolia]